MTKQDAKTLEQLVRSMNERQYWALISWFGSGLDGPLWNYLRPPSQGKEPRRPRRRLMILVPA
jgi:hypothetical protein